MSHGSWLLIIIVSIILLLPSNIRFTRHPREIAILLLAYVFYVFVLEIASRTLGAHYDSTALRITRIAINLLMVSGLVFLSGGERSYCWILYLLPLFQVVIYLKRTQVLIAVLLIIICYWAAAFLSHSPLSLQLDYTQLFIYTAFLLQLTYGFYWFVRSAKDSMKLQVEEMEALRRTALDITAQLELKQEELLTLIIKRAVELLQAYNGGIYLYDEERRELTVVADWGGEQSIVGHKLSEGEGMSGQIVLKKEPMIINDYSTWEDRSHKLDSITYHAVVGVPLEVKERLLGVLYVTQCIKERKFTARDARMLSLFASQAAVAINNADVFKKLSLLYNFSRNIGSALSLDEILELTLKEALSAVGTDEGSIMIFDPKNEELEIKAWMVQGKLREDRPRKKFHLGEGIAGHAASTREAYNWSANYNDDRFVPSFTERPLRSILSVPIIQNGRVFCIINADSTEADRFNDSHIKLLSTLASHVAIAVESQRLIDISISLSSLTLENLYTQIVESACYLMGADLSMLFLESEQTHELEFITGFPHRSITMADQLVDQELMDRIFDTGQHEIINDAQTNSLVKQSLKDSGAQALMGVRLSIHIKQAERGGVTRVGVLFVSTKDKREFTQRDAEIYKSMANQAATAIINARLNSHLRESFNYQQSLIANAFEAIVAINRQGIIDEFNISAERILGYRREEIIGQHVHKLYEHKADATRAARLLLDKEHNGRLVDFHTTVVSSSGEKIAIRLSACLLDSGTVGFFQDPRQVEGVIQHIKHLKDLLETGTAITATDDLQSALEATVNRARETLHADPVCLYSYDSVHKEIKLPPIRRELLVKDEVSVDVGPTSIVRQFIERDDFYFKENVQEDKLLGGDFVTREKIYATAVCPLRIRGNIIGMMFCNYRDAHTFTDQDKTLIRQFASEAAIAINNAQLYEETGRKAAQLNALSRAIPGLIADLSYDASLKNVLERARELTRADIGALGVINSERKFQPFITAYTDPQKKPFTGNPPSVHGLFGQLLQYKQVINLQDLTQYGPSPNIPTNHPQIGSFLGVPIIFKGRSLGNLYVANKLTAERFSQEDELGLKLLAALAALRIESEHAQVQEDESAELTISVAYLLLSRWARNVRLSGLKISNELTELRKALLGTTHEKSLAKISQIISELNSPSHQIQMGFNEQSRQNLNFSQLLGHTLERLVLERSIKVTPQYNIEPVLFIKGNRLLIEFALNIILENAIEAMERTAQHGTLRVDCSRVGGVVLTRVSDTGAGIPAVLQKDLFRKPVMGNKGNLAYASYTAAMIVRSEKGEISVSRTIENEGTTIEFWLPESGY